MCMIGDFQHGVSPFIEVVIIWEIVQKSSKMFEEFFGRTFKYEFLLRTPPGITFRTS